MPRRIFLAINLDEKTKNYLDSLKKRWPQLPCKWVKKEGLHLTLVFLGYLGENQLTLLTRAAKEIGPRHQPFSVFFNKVSYGPTGKFPPRLLWVEGEVSSSLSALKNDLDEALKKELKFFPEEREFKPHITLGRIKTFSWRRLEKEERPIIDFPLEVEVLVNSFEIMESHLKRQGAEYQILDSIKLNG
jgi:2'-5' RNA ligase